ncbi:MAG: transposase domain-containing protein [Gammaproteobacteria bacterium]|nr:transposase domain-containing protein [Gammaproteobacteria bacterium]
MDNSLTASCKLNGLNPIVWLTGVLTGLPPLPKEDKCPLEQLLANNWNQKPAQPTFKEVLETNEAIK